jgi:hypothetical protein
MVWRIVFCTSVKFSEYSLDWKSNSSSAGHENSLPPLCSNRGSKEPTTVPSPKPGSSIPDHPHRTLFKTHFNIAGRYGTFGIATGQSFRGEIFHTRPGRPWGSPGPLYNGYCFYFPEVKRSCHRVEPSLHLTSKLRISTAVPLDPSWAFMDCYRENFMAFSSQRSGLPRRLPFRFQDQN